MPTFRMPYDREREQRALGMQLKMICRSMWDGICWMMRFRTNGLAKVRGRRRSSMSDRRGSNRSIVSSMYFSKYSCFQELPWPEISHFDHRCRARFRQ